ncbi:MAG: pyridoxamine 5'-phosphate oxidase family protein [Gammaproteobacteria bacterium]
MTLSPYHDGMRALQDLRDTRALADRLAEITLRQVFSEDDRGFIARATQFFLATADAEGRPECSYKGGAPGFVRVLDDRTLAFPDYDGNGMYRSLGNLRVNPHVGMLFVDFEGRQRIRVNGTASVDLSDPLQRELPGAVFVVRVTVREIFPNCPRYLHPVTGGGLCEHAPRVGHEVPGAAWKQYAVFQDVLPERDRGG